MKLRPLYVFLIILFACLFNAYAQDNYVVAFGKLKVEWGNTDNTKITLYEDGKEIDSYRPEKNGKFQFTLELNHMYMFWFEKKGHVTKKVQFNTAVPETVTSDPEFIPFPDFDFYVTLFKTYPEVDTMFFTKPVGKIQYSADKNDFDWDKNYTLEIQRRMEEIEEEIKRKHEDKIQQEKEQEELARQNEIQAEEDRKQAEKQALLDKERQEKEAKDRATKEKRIAELEEEKRKQEQKDKEKAERKAEKIKETPLEPEIAGVNEQKDKDTGENKPEIPDVANETTEIKEANNRTLATNTSIKQNTNEQSDKPTYTGTVIKKTKPAVKKVEKVEIAGRTTTKTEITEYEVTLIYVKVEYTWGGRFFFIEDEPGVFRNISEQYYNRKVKNK